MKRTFSSKCIFLWLVLLTVRVIAVAQVHISNVEQLYSAVNDPANVGVTLRLAAGTYMLSTIDSKGAARPKGGRIELQMNMSIVGVAGDKGAVIINASGLPTSSFPQTVNGVATGPNAAIRMGLGFNALEWLTVRDAVNGQANIDTGLQSLDPGATYIRVEHVASSGSTRGLNILNFGPQTSGQTIDAEVIDSDFFENPYTLSEGIRVGNFLGANGSTVNVWMSGNRAWGQKQGRIIVNNRTNSSTVNVISTDNRFYDNGAGTNIFGGLSSNGIRADGNTIHFDALADETTDNTGETEFDYGGIIIMGAENDSASGGGGSNNTVKVRLWLCPTLGNALHDLYGAGARSNFLVNADPSLSQKNHVLLEIRGIGNEHGGSQPVESFDNSLPGPPDYGNSIKVIE